MEKLLPQNIEAECGVLGSIIIDPEAITQVTDFLFPEDFYRDAHRTLYEAMVRLYEAREPADFITICDELERRQKLADVGGASYITSLLNEVPTSGNVAYYGRIVERTAILRRLIHAAGQIAAIAYEEGDAVAALDVAEQLIYHIKRASAGRHATQSITSLYLDYYDSLLAMLPRGAVIGVPTGFTALDRLTGGLQKSDLIILAGRPSMGKTALALCIARHAAMRYVRGVLLFSLEMSGHQLIQRLVAMEARVDVQRLRLNDLEPDEKERARAVGGPIAGSPLWINDTTGLSLLAIRSEIRRELAEHPIELIIIDYLGKLKGVYDDGKRIHDRVQEVSEIARELKNLAREFNVPVLALAQLNRAVESRQSKMPQLADLRDSGDIEQEADIVAFIHRDDYYAGKDAHGRSLSTRPGIADIYVAKHRNGPVETISLGFEVSQTRFFTVDAQGREVEQ